MMYETKISQVIKTDVVVIGGGSAGCCSAIAAARLGQKVLLVEKNSALGGISTHVIDTFYGFYLPRVKNQKVVSGIGDQVVALLEEKKAAIMRENTYGAGTGITYEQEVLKVIWEDLLKQYHVDVLLHTIAIDVLQDDHCITGIVLSNKKELLLVQADVYIDCSGDGDIAYRAGYEFDGAGKCTLQSMTTTFRVGNIDEKAAAFTKQDLWKWMKEANDSGKYHLPRLEGSVHKTNQKGICATNMVRINIEDPTDVFALSKAEMEGRKQALEYYRFMKEYLPGYENSVLLNFSSQIGVRETRRIVGEYVLTQEDVLEARKFDDGILLCGAPMEDHDPSSTTKWKYVKEGDAYQLPYRCLVPKGSKNLLIAGRCVSATHDAQASMRSIAQCMGMGEAAGTAAAIAITTQKNVGEIDVQQLKATLKEHGAMVER